MAVLGLPVVLLASALSSDGGIEVARGVLTSAAAPLAVLLKPVVLLASALTPLAVLKLPVVLLKSATTPLAVLKSPVVLLERAQL